MRIPELETPTRMKLNHIDLQVSNVSAARVFFETHFGLRCVFQRREELAMLEDDAGLSLGVSNLFDSPPPAYPPDFHIGFILSRESEVRAIHDRLMAANVEIRTSLSRGGPNLYFICVGPDRLVIEVRAPLDDSASGGSAT
jgi:catechol 2,3-dioxygenase-like lactoylglutathione lyase family enzyme